MFVWSSNTIHNNILSIHNNTICTLFYKCINITCRIPSTIMAPFLYDIWMLNNKFSLYNQDIYERVRIPYNYHHKEK